MGPNDSTRVSAKGALSGAAQGQAPGMLPTEDETEPSFLSVVPAHRGQLTRGQPSVHVWASHQCDSWGISQM